MTRTNITEDNFPALFEKVSILIEQTRAKVTATINVAEVYTKYHIGCYIVEEEQHGEGRAQYGKKLLIRLSERLTEKFGSGWSVENLTLFRKFYLVYSNSVISDYEMPNSIEAYDNENFVISDYEIQQDTIPIHKFVLSWTHYLVLMRIDNPKARSFYGIEAKRENWSVRQLQRQYSASLYERLALSRNKDEVMRLSREGQIIERPADIIKSPLSLEFLGLKPDSLRSESKLENAIISKMQQFLLELGKGFLFEARQKRFTFDEDNFYVDLVIYNRLLQCYVLIDLKVDKLTHQDLGQMQMYVNYYDRHVRQSFEKPTIGILLCREKRDALVELTLPKDSNIYATQYALYLPDKKTIQGKLMEWIKEFQEDKNEE